MKNETPVEQIWKDVWISQQDVSAREMFGHVLFIEGYKTIKKYFSPVTRRVLEGGGGTGRYGIQLAADNPKAQVTVVDIVPESLELGKRAASDRGISNIDFQINNLQDLSFPDNAFDLIVSDAVIQVFENYFPPINEMARVLEPGGRLIISVCNKWNIHTLYKLILKLFNKPYRYGYEKSFTHQELRQAVTKAGLSVIAEDGFLASYGFTRHQSLPMRVIGKLCDLVARIIDPLTDGYFTYLFGFEIVVVAQKHTD